MADNDNLGAVVDNQPSHYDLSTNEVEQFNFESTCLNLLQQAVANQTHLVQQTNTLAEQNVFLYQQMLQLFGNVTIQIQQGETATQEALQKFQTGGPQRAMASVFHKLFRDLLKHINQLDELVITGKEQERSANELVWIEALHVARDHFESILVDWGCTPMVINIGQDEFNPEIHEAIEPEADESFPLAPENVIVKVCRRGWKLQDYILQYPLVVVM